MSLSDTLKITRQKAFMTQEAFANEIQVTVATINRWENGRSKPNLGAMKKIKQFCNQYGLPYEAIEQDWLSYEMEKHK